MMSLSRDTEFFYSPSRNGITYREPSETRYPLTEPKDWRPLVVIDPEDREQVGRLADRLALGSGTYMDRAQSALRSLIEPPKPEEPTGRYAVVEDDKGGEWCHVDSISGGYVWQLLGQPSGKCVYARWTDITVVRVLSEGVTP